MFEEISMLRVNLSSNIYLLLTTGRHYTPAARGAIGAKGVKFQPRINAFDVEAMTALRKHSEFVSDNEFHQANCTIREVVVVSGICYLRKIFQDFLQTTVCHNRVGWRHNNDDSSREFEIDNRTDELEDEQYE
ncbi:hypothetical protein Adt_13098 [Abeliophyllum distichum]|uniref:Uncharacterized protein n=1 Tax=Abeliophyllum distichum TaxID=126358 RepID=A0ABD1TVT9_9LAMI